MATTACCAGATILLPRLARLAAPDARKFVKAAEIALTRFVALPMCDTKSQKSLLPNKRVLLG